MKKNQKKWIYFLLVFFMFSCVPQNKIGYFNDIINDSESITNKDYSNNVIKPHDVLLINVTSFDDVSFNYFESQSDGRIMQGANELALTAMGYTVDDLGNVRFPILGKINFEDLSLEDASLKLEKALAPYFNQPNVSIKFAYKKITILGEVRNPGFHTYSREKLNIFEAIGIASDVEFHGNLNKIILLREDGNKTNMHKLDLTQKNLIASEYYYVQPNDIIIVNPRNSVKWSEVSTPFSLALSLITTTILILNYIN